MPEYQTNAFLCYMQLLLAPSLGLMASKHLLNMALSGHQAMRMLLM